MNNFKKLQKIKPNSQWEYKTLQNLKKFDNIFVTEGNNQSKYSINNLFLTNFIMNRKKLMTGIVALLLISLVGFTGSTLIILNNISSTNPRVLTGEERTKAIKKIFENNRGNILNQSKESLNNQALASGTAESDTYTEYAKLASNLSYISPAFLNNKLEYTKSVTRKGPAICTSRGNNNYGLNNSEFESYTFFGDNNRSISRSVSSYQGNIYSAFYNITESNMSESVEYAGGAYAVKIKSKYDDQLVTYTLKQGNAQGESGIVGTDVVSAPVSYTEEPIIEPVNPTPDDLLKQYFGENANIFIVKNSLGQDVYAIDSSYQEFCNTTPTYKSPNFWIGENYDYSQNSVGDSTIIYRYFYDLNTFASRGFATYLNTINDVNLLEITEVLNNTVEDMTFEVANSRISNNFGQPRNKEYFYDYTNSSTISSIYREIGVSETIDEIKTQQLNLITSDLKDSNSNVYLFNYSPRAEFSNHLADRSFFITGELGDRIFATYNIEKKFNDLLSTNVIINSGDKSEYSLNGRLVGDLDDIEIINSFLGSPVSNTSIQDIDLTLGTKTFKSKVYSYEIGTNNYIKPVCNDDGLGGCLGFNSTEEVIEVKVKEFILIVNDGDKKFALRFSKYLSGSGSIDIEYTKDLISTLGLRYFAYSNEKDMNDLTEILTRSNQNVILPVSSQY